MRSGEIDLGIVPNARAGALVKAGANVEYVWDQGIIDFECFLVPKAAPNPKAAMQLINDLLDPKNQATFAARIGYGPVNTQAYEQGILTEKEISFLPSAKQNLGKQLVADPTWYASPEANAAALRFGKLLQ